MGSDELEADGRGATGRGARAERGGRLRIQADRACCGGKASRLDAWALRQAGARVGQE